MEFQKYSLFKKSLLVMVDFALINHLNQFKCPLLEYSLNLIKDILLISLLYLLAKSSVFNSQGCSRASPAEYLFEAS